MKKLIAILVVFALFAGAAFAQPAIGGQFKAGATLFAGYTGEETDIISGTRFMQNGTEGFLNASFGDAEMGGFARFYARTDGDYHSPGAFAFAWWQPNQYFKIKIGSNPDRDWGTANITGWGFNGEAQDFVATDQDSNEWRNYGGSGAADPVRNTPAGGHASWMYVARATGFYPGIKAASAVLLSLYPMDGLTVNFGIPFGTTDHGSAQNSTWEYEKANRQWLKLDLQVEYAIEEIGTFYLTYDGQGAQADPEDATKDKVESPIIYASFYLNQAIENVAVDIGLGFQPKLISEVTPPMQIGLGVAYTAEEFGVKLRVGAKIAGKDAADNADPMEIGFHVLPYYKLEAFTFYLNAGVGMVVPEEGDSIMGWYFNPYIRKSVNGASLMAGIKVYSSGTKGGKTGVKADETWINWAVPIGINVYF
jgi:hypothetical protein